MTPTRLHHRHSTRIRVRPEYTPRLRLRPKGRPNAYIDGAWWPRSDDLAAELPDLLAVLEIRLGPVPRVVYDESSWLPAPRQITVNHRPVQLDAYLFELSNTMYVHGGTGEMIVLRVISSTTDDETAHTALMAAVALAP